MPDPLARVFIVLSVWAAASVLLFWDRLPSLARRTLSLLASVAGLVFLILALNTRGLRESPTTARFLVGEPYVTELASASASLPYYVATAACLLLGTAGLGLGDESLRRLASHRLAAAILLSFLVTALRFALEKAAAPAAWTWAVGVTWLAVPVGAALAVSLRAEGKALGGSLMLRLLAYALVVRAGIACLYLAATTLGLGSHYDLSAVTSVSLSARTYRFPPGSLAQLLSLAVVPQIFFWPIYTVLAGLLGALVAVVVTSAGRAQGSPQPAPTRLDADARTPRA